MKFKVQQVIFTDDDGFLVLKGLLPQGSILWTRSVNGEVIIHLDSSIDIKWIEKNLNSIWRTSRV